MNQYLAKYKALDLPGKLIAINVIIWLMLQLLRLLSWIFLSQELHWQEWLALHADTQSFFFKPWTLLTYMFVHADLGVNFFHLLFNMLWLWWFGHAFLRYHTEGLLLKVYLLGGIIAGFVYEFAAIFMDSLQGTLIVGASGAIFALVGAVAMRQPNEVVYMNFFVRIIPVKMKWIAVVALLINVMDLMQGSNTGGIICHFGGMAFGLCYGLIERYPKLFQKSPRMTATKGGAGYVHNDRKADHDYNQRKKEHQQQIDAILDKISKSGYDGLTAEEKAILFDASQRRKS